MNTTLRGWALVVTALLGCLEPVLAADVVIDRTATPPLYYEGRVDPDNDNRDYVILIDIAAAIKSKRFKREDVVNGRVEVMTNSTLIDHFTLRWKALVPQDAEALLLLADWCTSNCTPPLAHQAELCWEEVIKHNPDHLQARMKLGYTKSGDGWVKATQRRETFHEREAAWRTDPVSAPSWKTRIIVMAAKDGEIDDLGISGTRIMYRAKQNAPRKVDGALLKSETRYSLGLYDVYSESRKDLISEDWTPIRGPVICGDFVAYAKGRWIAPYKKYGYHDLYVLDVRNGRETPLTKDNRKTQVGPPMIGDSWLIWRHYKASEGLELDEEPIYVVPVQGDLRDYEQYLKKSTRRTPRGAGLEDIDLLTATCRGDRLVWWKRSMGLLMYHFQADMVRTLDDNANIANERPSLSGDQVMYSITAGERRGLWIYDLRKESPRRVDLNWQKARLWEQVIAGVTFENDRYQIRLYDLERQTQCLVAQTAAGETIGEFVYEGATLAWTQYLTAKKCWALIVARPDPDAGAEKGQ